MNTTSGFSILAVVLAAVAVVFGLLFTLSRADRRRIDDFGRQRGWILKRVWWLPAYLILGRWGVMKSYYRAVFTCDAGKEERLWFESTFRTEPILSDGPFSNAKKNE